MKLAVSTSLPVKASPCIAASFLTLLLAAPLVQPAMAQGAKPHVTPRLVANRPLTAPPGDFPLPTPQDAKFVAGYQNQWTNRNPVTYLQLHSKSQPSQLASWYQQVMRAQGFEEGKQAPPNKKGGSTLFGRKGSSSVSVRLDPIVQGKEVTTSIKISWHQ